MLEPDRTDVHERTGGSKAMLIAVVVALLLVGAIGAGLFLFKDRLFLDQQTGASAPANP
jgi:hypothetical protein